MNHPTLFRRLLRQALIGHLTLKHQVHDDTYITFFNWKENESSGSLSRLDMRRLDLELITGTCHRSYRYNIRHLYFGDVGAK
jgi:hypothetical protein